MKTEQVRKEHDDMAQTCDAWGHVVETHMILMSKVDDRPPNYRCPVCGEIVDAGQEVIHQSENFRRIVPRAAEIHNWREEIVDVGVL